jgi:hypothetical protein
VQTLLIALNNGNPPREVFSELVPRLQSKDATTVLKVYSLYEVHYKGLGFRV